MSKKEFEKIGGLYQLLLKQTKLDCVDVNKELLISKWYVSDNIKSTVDDISSCMNIILSTLSYFTLGEIYTEQEKENMKSRLAEIFDAAMMVKSKEQFIIYAFEHELSI